jgi:hypothetical protein
VLPQLKINTEGRKKMKFLRNLIQRIIFWWCLPELDSYTPEEWKSINDDYTSLSKLAVPFAYCGRAGIDLTFKHLGKPDPRNLLLVAGLGLIAKRRSTNRAERTLIATRIAEWFAAQTEVTTTPNNDEALVGRLSALFCELKLSVDEDTQAGTWLRAISTFPKVAAHQLPFQLARITRIDSPWWPLIYDLISRPETSTPTQEGEPDQELPADMAQREEVEAVAASIFQWTAPVDFSVRDVSRLAFSHPNARVRMYLIQGLANLPDEAGRAALLTGLEDEDPQVRLHLVTSFEDSGLIPLSESITSVLEVMPSAPPAVVKRALQFILGYDLASVPGLVAVLDPNNAEPSTTAVHLLYNIFRNSPKRKLHPEELVAAYKPYVAKLSTVFSAPWIDGRLAGRLAYVIATIDKQYLLPLPAVASV